MYDENNDFRRSFFVYLDLDVYIRFCVIKPGVHDTSEHLEKALRENDSEISPSTIFALAAIDEGVSLNTFVLLELAASILEFSIF